MSGAEGGWRPHPDAPDHADLPPVVPGRVVGIGALCDLGPARLDGEMRSQSFSVAEFVTLEDGRRVILHTERGLTIGWRSAGESEVRAHLNADALTQDVLTVVLPDDEKDAADHPWSWLAELARARGLEVTTAQLRILGYEVVFTDEVREWLAHD